MGGQVRAKAAVWLLLERDDVEAESKDEFGRTWSNNFKFNQLWNNPRGFRQEREKNQESEIDGNGPNRRSGLLRQGGWITLCLWSWADAVHGHEKFAARAVERQDIGIAKPSAL